ADRGPATAVRALSRRARQNVRRRGGVAWWRLRRVASPMRRIPWELAALPALGVARLLPDTGVGLGLRLAAAAAWLPLPGALVARALGRPGASATLAFSLAGLFAASAVMFAVHSSLWFALGLYAVIGAVALPFAFRPVRFPLAAAGVLGLGIAFGVALWWV